MSSDSLILRRFVRMEAEHVELEAALASANARCAALEETLADTQIKLDDALAESGTKTAAAKSTK